MLISGCASTVDGAALPVAGGSSTSGPVTTAPSALNTAAPKTAASTYGAPDASTPDTTDPDTAAPPTAQESTARATTERETTPPKPTAIDQGPKGVPDPTKDHLRKKIGQDAGIVVPIDGVDTRILTFMVLDIDPDMGSKCDDPKSSPRGAALIGVQIKYRVQKAYRPTEDGAIAFARESFTVKDAKGGFYNYTGSPTAKKCLSKGLLPADPLKPGDSGTGWIVLDSAVRYGVVQFGLASLEGISGWEWVIPGS